MEPSGGEQEPGAVRYRAPEGPREGRRTWGRGAELGRVWGPLLGAGAQKHNGSGLAGDSGPGTPPPTPLYPQAPGPALGRRAAATRPEPGAATPAASAAARQPGLPGASAAAPGGAAPLRRRSGELRARAPPHLGTAPAPPPAPPPAPLSTPCGPSRASRNVGEAIHPAGSTLKGRGRGINSKGSWGLSWKGRWPTPRAGC